MYNGILHVNTKINIIVMMKIIIKNFVSDYVLNMCQKCPRNCTMNFEEKNGTAKLKRPFYPRDLVSLAENGRSVRVQ